MSEASGGHYGALEVPALAPGGAAGDQALTVLGGYFRAFLNTYAAGLWHAIAPASLPVKRFFTHDPRDGALSENDFPSLYLFRSGGEPAERIAEDWILTSDTVTVLWVFPREGSLEIARIRRPFVAALVKLLDRAIRQMRDPSFVVQGDADPSAAAYGSNVFGLGGIVELAPAGRWEMATVSVGGEGEGDAVTYAAAVVPLRIRERDTFFGGPAPRALAGPQPDFFSVDDTAGFSDPAAVDVVLTTPDGAVVTAEYANGTTP